MPKQLLPKDAHSGSSFRPYQKPSIHADILKAVECLDGLPTLQRMARKLATKTNIVIISGAGISTNANIPCFKSASRTKISSRNIFDLSAYSSMESANLLHQSELQMFELASKHEPNPFELFMEHLAQSGRLHRHYTQNIDCRTSKLPALSQKTIHLHGRLDRMRCHMYSQHTVPVEGQNLQELIGARFPICDEKNSQRSREVKRLHGVGFLRPDVLLYNEGDGADPQILSAFKEDLSQKIDAVIIVGTTLHIPLLQKFTTKLCKRMKRRMVVWLSNEEPSAPLRSLIDFKFLQDCDEFASQVSQGFGNFEEVPHDFVDLTVSDDEDDKPCQREQSSVLYQPQPRRTIIDLTVDSEHCCVCSNVLGEGGDVESRVFVFDDCGCVLCGECVGDDRSSNLFCPRCDLDDSSFAFSQRIRQVFGLECTICFKSAGIDSDVEGACTPCGHIFCQGCIDKLLDQPRDSRLPKCPNCKANIPNDLKRFRRFHTIQRGVDIAES